MKHLTLYFISLLFLLNQNVFAQCSAPNPLGTDCSIAPLLYTINTQSNYQLCPTQDKLFIKFTPNASVVELNINSISGQTAPQIRWVEVFRFLSCGTSGNKPQQSTRVYVDPQSPNSHPSTPFNPFLDSYSKQISGLTAGTEYMLILGLLPNQSFFNFEINDLPNPPYFGSCPSAPTSCYTDKLSNNGFSFFTVDPNSGIYNSANPFFDINTGGQSQICGWEHAGGTPTVENYSSPYVVLDYYDYNNGNPIVKQKDAIGQRIGSTSSTNKYMISFRAKRTGTTRSTDFFTAYVMSSTAFSTIKGAPDFTNPSFQSTSLFTYFQHELSTEWDEYNFCINLTNVSHPKDYIVFTSDGSMLLDDIKMRGVENDHAMIFDQQVGPTPEKFQSCGRTIIGSTCPYPDKIDNNLPGHLLTPITHYYDWTNSAETNGLQHTDRAQTIVFADRDRDYELDIFVCGENFHTQANGTDVITVKPSLSLPGPVDYVFRDDETLTHLASQVAHSRITYKDKTFVLTKNFRIDGRVYFDNCTFYALKGSSINIAPGKIAYFANGTKILSCTHPNGNRPLWKGIEVESVNSTPAALRITNSTISDAEIAVMIGKRGDDGLAIPGTGKGSLTATNATFHNNAIDVYASPNNNNGSYVKLYNSTFESNVGTVAGLVYPENTRIYLDWVSRVQILGCTLSYDHSVRTGSMGIYAKNSSFYVQKNGATRTEIENFETGIKSIVTTEDVQKSFIVDDTRFKNNARGIYAEAIDFLSITNSGFNINNKMNNLVDYGTKNHLNYGLYLVDCEEFEVEENIITSSDQREAIGIIVLASPGFGGGANPNFDQENEIYKNDIQGLSTAIMVHGVHQNLMTKKGLQILCNDFYQNNYDIGLRSYYEDGVNYQALIAEDQGSDPNFPPPGGPSADPAGNIFSQSCPGATTSNIYSDNLFGSASINYYYHDLSSTTEPTCGYIAPPFGNVGKISCANTSYDASVSCPSRVHTELLPYHRKKSAFATEVLQDLSNDKTELLKIYPNPTSNQLSIEYLIEKNATLELYTLEGKKIRSTPLVQNQMMHSLDVSNLPNGIYYLTIRGEHDTTQREKFIIQR